MRFCSHRAFLLSEVFVFAFSGVKSDCGIPGDLSQIRGEDMIVVVWLV